MSKTTPIKLTGKVISVSRLSLQTDDYHQITQYLKEAIGEHQDEHGIPVIVDAQVKLDLQALVKLLKSNGLQFMAMVDGLNSEQAKVMQLTILPADQAVPRLVQKPVAKTTTKDEIIENVVRTGQQVINLNGDIHILADVNSGAEIISVGSVTVRGSARCRIVAGVQGDTAATIKCKKLYCSLVSIAGTYCLAEDIPAEFVGKKTQIRLGEQEKLIFEYWQN